MSYVSPRVKELLKKNDTVLKIDLGCGENKQKGCIGIDMQKLKGVDIVHNLETYPYPLPEACASLVVASHLVEHINPANFGFIKFMDEVWRILKVDGEFMISVPYAGSPGYWQDPTHVNPCSHATFFYFDPLHRSNLYRFYRPKPWKIKDILFNEYGNLEVCLVKRLIDKSYQCK